MRTLFYFLSIGFFFTSFGQSSNLWSLQKCVDYALENNITILQNQVQGEIIANNLTQAQMSRLPSLNGSGSHNYNNGRSIDPFSNSFVNQTIQSNSFSLNTGVLLYGGNQINNSIKQTKVSKLANDKSVEVVKNQIALSVASTYLQILQAEENLKIAKKQEELTESQLNRAKKLVASGTTNQGTVLNLQAQLANDKVQSINAENQIQLAYNAMINLLQLDTDTPFEIEAISIEELPVMPEESVAELYQLSLGNLPEIKQAELTITQSQLGEKIAGSSLLPSLSAYGNMNTVYSESGVEATYLGIVPELIGVTENTQEKVYGATPQFAYNTQSFGNQLNNNLGQSVGLSLSVPIFNGYRNKTSVENAKLSTTISELSLENTKNQLKNDITTAYTNLKGAKSRYEAAALSETAQRLNFDFNEKRFDAGLTNSVELLAAKNQWFQSQLQLNNAKYEYLFRNSIIEFYKGNKLKL